jgi:hypothetical protein
MARSAKLTDILARSIELAPSSRGRGQRSPAYRWLKANHDALSSAFADTPPNWGGMAASMAEAGLTDADGKPPTKDGARQTWFRVRRDVAAARAKAEAKRKAAPVPSSSATTAASPLPVPCPPVRPAEQRPASQQGSGTAAEKVKAAYASLRAREIPVPERINPSKTEDR